MAAQLLECTADTIYLDETELSGRVVLGVMKATSGKLRAELARRMVGFTSSTMPAIDASTARCLPPVPRITYWTVAIIDAVEKLYDTRNYDEAAVAILQQGIAITMHEGMRQWQEMASE